MSKTPSPRIAWTVEALKVQPDDRVLEIGCGQGVAVSLVYERLTSRRITAIDRSGKMVEMARKRNAGCIKAGKATTVEASFPDLDFGEQRFGTVFAIHVGFFWQRPERELAAIRRLLTSDGEFFLFFQPLDPGKIEAMIDQATAIFAACGLAVRRVISEEIAGGTIAGVIAQPVGADG